MTPMPASVAAFLQGRRFAVAGVSRDPRQTANAILRKLRQAGYEVVPVNPATSEVEGVACSPSVLAVPGTLDGVVAVTPPRAALDIVRQCHDRGVQRIWFHRSVGAGSLAADAVRECAARGIQCIAGGCPLMYCAPVDPFHRCLRWGLGVLGRLPH